MGEVDLHLFAEGQHWKIYDKFGAHVRTIGDANGVYFSVWAPNAQRVSVVGDFNGWDGRANPMRKLVGSGVWELFLPGIKQGAHYKFEICTASQERSVRFFQPARKIDCISGVRSGTLHLERWCVDGIAPDAQLAEKPHQHL
jgi:1,4-alpha-glucan branching enzyme